MQCIINWCEPKINDKFVLLGALSAPSASFCPQHKESLHGLALQTARANSARESNGTVTLRRFCAFNQFRVFRPKGRNVLHVRTSRVSNQDVITGEAPTRYAQALLELAESKKSLKTVEKDLASLKTILAGSAPLRAALSNPVFATEDKVNAIVAVAKKAKLGTLVTNFAGTVAQNRRGQDLPAIITVFEGLLAKRRGSEIARITSAKKLTAAQLTKIKGELKKSLGRTVDVETDVDPDLLGGFVVRVGSRLFDSSLKTKLANLQLALKDA